MVENRSYRIGRIAAVVFFGLVIGLPFYWLALTALKTPQEALQYPPTWIPHTIRWQNIPEAFGHLGVGTFVNSFIFTSSVTILQLILTITTGFAIAKMPLPGRNGILAVFVLTMFVPFHVLLVPTFVIVRSLNLIDTWPGLVIPIVAQTAFGTFLFRQFFVSVPNELIEAARIDGANWGQLFVLIVLPVAKPAIAAYVSVTSLNAWNMYIWPLVATYDPNMRVLPLALANLSGEYSVITPNVMMMAVLLSTLPLLVLFVTAQRWFISGLGGAVKE